MKLLQAIKRMEQASNEQGLYIYGDSDVSIIEIDNYLKKVFANEPAILNAVEWAKRDFVNLFEVGDVIYDNYYDEGHQLLHQDITLEEFVNLF